MSSLSDKTGTALRILRTEGPSKLLDLAVKKTSQTQAGQRVESMVNSRLTRNRDPYRVALTDMTNCPHCHGQIEQTAAGKLCPNCRDLFV